MSSVRKWMNVQSGASAVVLMTLVSLVILYTQPVSAAESLADAINKVMPAVVRVRAVRRGQLPFPSNLRLPSPPFAGHVSEGAGIVWREDGYIVTTFSVVNGAEEIEVTRNDERKMEARLVGIDPATDFAVVKVDTAGLPTATLGDASTVKVGEPVFAIGHPAGFTGTAITGIISGLNRTLPLGNRSLSGLIQTDLALAPGFSGGPLANARGEVIGVNVAQFRPPTFPNQPAPPQPNLSFALPVNLVKRAAGDIIARGRVSRAFLGVQLLDVDEEKQRQTDLPDREGAFVAQVVPDSPARKADIRPGDVVRRVGGKEVSNAASVLEEIHSRKPGDKVILQIWREGAARDVEVALGELPDEPRPSFPRPFPPAPYRTFPLPPFDRRPDLPGEVFILPRRPVVRILTPKENETVKGTVPIRVSVPERERFPWLGIWVDDQFVAMVRASDEPFMLDTTRFPNGAHTLRFKAISLRSDAAPGASVRVKVENAK